MRHNLNLNPHIILPQPRDPHTSPQRLMIRHPLPKIPHHRLQRLIINRHMIRVHPIHLRPALPAGRLERQIHVRERLVDLRVDFFVEFACLRVPASFNSHPC